MKFFNGLILFFTPICLHVFLFDVEALHDFYFDRTSFNNKGMQSFAQFNYSLFGVSILAKFEYRDYEKEISY